MQIFTRRRFFGATAAAAATLSLYRPASAAKLATLGIDYAYYNPPSLILKQKGWLEAALGPLGTQPEWVLSLGSNKPTAFSLRTRYNSARAQAALHCSPAPTERRYAPSFSFRNPNGRLSSELRVRR